MVWIQLGNDRCAERTGLTRVERANWGETRTKNSFESARVELRRRNNWILIFEVARGRTKKRGCTPGPENGTPQMFM